MSRHYTPGYGEDLAHVHDVGFADFSRGAAPGLLALLRGRGIESGTVVDLGCGSGIWAAALAEAGYRVVGVDLSAPMIARARRRVPEGRFLHASFLAARLPACDAVTAIGESLGYLFDRRNSADQLARLFGRVHAALRPGGVFVFDLCEAGQSRGAGPRLGHWQGNDWAILLRVDEDPKRKLLTRRITTFRRVGRLWRRSVETHHVLLCRAADVARALRGAGFRVHFLRAYGSRPLLPRRVGFCARKPER